MKITVAIHVEGHGGAPRTHSASQTLDGAADAPRHPAGRHRN